MPSPRRFFTWAVVAGLVAAEVLLASRARPFTWQADGVSAIALLTLAGVVVLQPRLGQVTPRILARRSALALSGEGHPWGLRWTIWIAPLSGLAIWELFCYLGSPRAAHPTMSSMLDTMTASQVGRGGTFTLWLSLGWYLVTR